MDGIGEIVAAFEQGGYKLADTSYSSLTSGSVDNIDLILGTDSDHMLPMSYRTFGDTSNLDCMASFIETPIGIVLSGNMHNMIKNLPFLPNKIEQNSKNASIVCPLNLPSNTIEPFKSTFATKKSVHSNFIPNSSYRSKSTFCTSSIVPMPNVVEPKKKRAVPLLNLSATSDVEVRKEMDYARAQSHFLSPPGEVDANDHRVKPFIRRERFSIRHELNIAAARKCRKRSSLLTKQDSV